MKSSAFRALGASAALSLTGCVDEFVDVPNELSSFTVTFDELTPTGSPDAQLPAPRGTLWLGVRANAFGTDGKPLAWNGRARVKVTPGAINAVKDDRDGLSADNALVFVDGVASGQVEIKSVHSDARIWLVDDLPDSDTHAVGVTPIVYFDEPTLADINSIPPGGDNFTSLYVDGGTVGDFVRMERDGFVFEGRETAEDPCALAEPGATKRDLIVTATTPTGFYVTDLAEPPHPTLPGNFAHAFVYNFGFPEGLEPGKRLYLLAGTIQEFSGNTQITSPTYRVSYCPFVAGDDTDAVRAQQRTLELAKLHELEANAPVIGGATCGTGVSLQSCGYSSSNLAMESLESAVVQIPEAKLPDMWVRCDFDGDGQVSTFAQIGSSFGCADENDAECACNLACQTSAKFPSPDSKFEASHADKAFDATGKLCAERTGYQGFGQYIVQIIDNGVPGPRINLTSRDAFPEFDPELEENLGAHVRVRGNLQQVRAARPRWVVQARGADERNDTDVCCLPGEFCPAGLQPCTELE